MKFLKSFENYLKEEDPGVSSNGQSAPAAAPAEAPAAEPSEPQVPAEEPEIPVEEPETEEPDHTHVVGAMFPHAYPFAVYSDNTSMKVIDKFKNKLKKYKNTEKEDDFVKYILDCIKKFK